MIRVQHKRSSILFLVASFCAIAASFSLSQKSPSKTTTSSKEQEQDTIPMMMESRLRGALWSFFSGDALAAPSHWYYGGAAQIQQDYGGPITDYTKPKLELRGSILNKSDINGGGRGSFSESGISVIGDIINHGKKDYWSPQKSIHYHATLQKGENTLEAQLARVLMKSIVANRGTFDANHFRNAYIKFMTTPGSHNDTYASTCHRMFFKNLKILNLPPEECPDNDGHNVDAVDLLVLPTIAAMTASTKEQAGEVAAATAAVTRKSSQMRVCRAWGELVYDSLYEENDKNMDQHLKECAKQAGLGRVPSPRGADQMTACYLSSSFPATLDTLAKYIPIRDAWTGLVANANVGGENVHRGSILGAVLGARAGYEQLPTKLIDGLYDKDDLSKEIEEFVHAVQRKQEEAR
jgi:ADP-ribosylglycohydrolase